MIKIASYNDALKKLLERTSNPKLGLKRITSLLAAVGYRWEQCGRIVQIVGTNGKGSTSAFCESLLMAQGQSVALFTSPHLSCARERIRINGEMVSEEDFMAATELVLMKAALLDEEASFFECMLAVFIVVAQKKNVSAMIVEAGLGGRLDATTALRARVLGISSIDFDHQNILGNILAEIAHEKICAAHKESTVISVHQHAEVEEVLRKHQQQQGFSLHFADQTCETLGLLGPHQQKNAGLALKLVAALGITLEGSALKQGLIEVNWPGRYEKVVRDGVRIIFDGAHNPAGIKALLAVLKEDQQANEPPILVYGSLSGSNVQEKIALITTQNFQAIFLHVSKNPRREQADVLREYFVACGVPQARIHNFSSFEEVKKCAQMLNRTVLVCGSLYTIGELRAQILDVPADPLMPNF